MKKLISSAIVMCILMLFAFEVYTLTADSKERSKPLPRNHGNFEIVRALLGRDRKTEEFSFAAVGDACSFGTYDNISAKLADEGIRFIVILGDFVHKGTLEDHHFYRREIEKPYYLNWPVFYSVGNHEIDKGSKFTLRDFEEIYGPTNVSFSYQGHLFIILRTFPPMATDETLSFLERELSTKRALHDKVFVFSHIPLYQSPDFPTRPLKDSEAYVRLLEKYHVDYAISADYHGYARVSVNNVNYIVTGGGGSSLKNANKYGNFHHALVMKVRKGSISERILAVEKDRHLAGKVRHFAMARLSPWIMQNKSAALLLNALGIVLLVLAVLLHVGKHPSGSVRERPCFLNKRPPLKREHTP